MGNLTYKMSKLIQRLPELTAKAIEVGTPMLKDFVRIAKVELRPPTPAEVMQSVPLVSKGAMNVVSGSFLQMPVKKAALNLCVLLKLAVGSLSANVLDGDLWSDTPFNFDIFLLLSPQLHGVYIMLDRKLLLMILVYFV